MDVPEHFKKAVDDCIDEARMTDDTAFWEGMVRIGDKAKAQGITIYEYLYIGISKDMIEAKAKEWVKEKAHEAIR